MSASTTKAAIAGISGSPSHCGDGPLRPVAARSLAVRLPTPTRLLGLAGSAAYGYKSRIRAAGIAASVVGLLLMFPTGASAQSLSPCDPQTGPAILLDGLPRGLAPARWEEFGFRENYDTDSFVSGRITVEMHDRFGKSFFRGSLPEAARGGHLLRVSLDRGNRWVSITATFVETGDAGECTRVLDHIVAEKPPMRLVLRATRRGVLALGPYRVRSSPSLNSAIRAFGDPSGVRSRWGGNGCRVSWPLIGLVIQFANFGGYDACSPRYGRAQSVAIRGMNGRLWRTMRGLRIGQSVGQIRRRHASAEQHGPRSWWLVTGRTFIGPSCGGGPCPYAILSASVRARRVSTFRLWVGAAGD
jgi:hypothetical protein